MGKYKIMLFFGLSQTFISDSFVSLQHLVVVGESKTVVDVFIIVEDPPDDESEADNTQAIIIFLKHNLKSVFKGYLRSVH